MNIIALQNFLWFNILCRMTLIYIEVAFQNVEVNVLLAVFVLCVEGFFFFVNIFVAVYFATWLAPNF